MLYELACESVSEWRANDGGLTAAAADVRYVGMWADLLLAKVIAGDESPFVAMDLLDPFNTSTGTESDILCEAQNILASAEFDFTRREWIESQWSDLDSLLPRRGNWAN